MMQPGRIFAAVCAVLTSGLFTADLALAGPYVPITSPVWTPTLDAPAGPERHPGKEYSHEVDRSSTAAGGLVPDDQQNTMWDGSGGVADTFDYNGIPGTSGNPSDQVDALAHPADALFGDVVSNTTAILYSLRAGPNVQGAGVDIGAPVWYETTAGGTAPWATWPQVDQHGGQNLDGLEVFGPEGADDATRYSLFNDFAGANNGGVGCSIYDSAGTDGLADETCWLSHGALSSMFTGIQQDLIDLDALMLSGDSIMFSLWPIPGLPGFGVGDAVYLATRTSPVSAVLLGPLSHGGHLWTNDWLGNNVDALEAAAPEPASLALTVLGLAALGLGRRRKV